MNTNYEAPKDRRKLLKIKVKSLAAEAKIIRKEERKSSGDVRNEMWEHRTRYLRRIARNTHLAYGIIRGLSVKDMEPNPSSDPDWKAIDRMIKEYGDGRSTDQYLNTLKSAA